MNTIHTSDCLAIHLNPLLRVVEVEWLDFTSGENFRGGVREVLRQCQEHAVQGWICNNLRMRAIRAADLAWYETELAPQFRILPTLCCVVLVESGDAMNRMALADLARRRPANLPFSQATCPTVVAARTWVRAALTAA